MHNLNMEQTQNPTIGATILTTIQQQQNRRLRTDSHLGHWGGGLKCILLVPNLLPLLHNVCCSWIIKMGTPQKKWEKTIPTDDLIP